MDGSAHTAVTSARQPLDEAGTAIALLDAHQVVVGWTETAQRLVGYSAAEAVGRSAADLLAVGADEGAQESPFSEEVRTLGRWSGRGVLRHRDGRRIGARLCVQSLSGHQGRAGWIVTAADQATLPPWAANTRVLESLPAALRLPTHPSIGVVIRDPQLRCTWVNDTQAAKDGIPVHQRLGRKLTEAAPGTQAATLEALMRQVLESGAPVFDVEFRASGPTAGRSGLSLSASFFRLDDAQGRALGVCVVSVDVTDRRRAHERLAVLGEASKRIGTTLDVMRTAQELADLTVPLLADHATVDLAEAVWTGGEPVVRLGTQGGDLPAFRRAGLASVRQGAPESLFAPGEPVLVPPMSPFTGVLRDGKSHFEPALGTCPRTWLNPDVARVERDRDDTNHSLIVVPVHARGTVLGVAVFLRKGDRAPFEEDDLLLAEELVSWAALCLDNARRYARERSAALTLQRHLLPRHPTGGSAADVAWRYLPADSHRGVGGDWCDVIPLSGGRVALVVGDVVGHGINAAATMGQLRTAVRTLANLDLPCEEVLARLDEQVIRVAETDSAPWDPDPGTMAATCLYAVYDPVTRRCAMACAGHLPPAIVDPHGTVAFPELPTGAPLGVGLVPFESVELELPEGSVLAFYSDGLIEAPDHDIGAGLDRLSTALARPGLPLEELCTSVLDTLSTAPSSDDVTLLLARTHAFGPSRVASWEFPADPSAVSDARSLATAQLALWGLEDQAASTELIVSELVTNAVRHAGGPILLRLIRDHVLTCEVHDTGSCFPHLRHPRLTDDNGRGLFLVDQLSHRWGSRDTPDGKLLWAELHLTPAP